MTAHLNRVHVHVSRVGVFPPFVLFGEVLAISSLSLGDDSSARALPPPHPPVRPTCVCK